MLGLDRALAVDGHAEGVDHAADQRRAHGHVDDGAGALDRVALADRRVGTEERHTDVVFLEVEHHPDEATGELDELTGHGRVQAVDAGDAIADGQHSSRLDDVDRGVVAGDLLLDDVGDLFGAKLHCAGFL